MAMHQYQFPPAPPMHFLITDKTGKSVIIEYVNGEIIVIPNEEAWQVCTNFIVHESSEDTKKSCRRYTKAQAFMNEKNGRLSEEEMMNLLDEVSQRSTCYSAVYNMNTGKVSIAIGRSYKEEDIRYFELKMK